MRRRRPALVWGSRPSGSCSHREQRWPRRSSSRITLKIVICPPLPTPNGGTTQASSSDSRSSSKGDGEASGSGPSASTRSASAVGAGARGRHPARDAVAAAVQREHGAQRPADHVGTLPEAAEDHAPGVVHGALGGPAGPGERRRLLARQVGTVRRHRAPDDADRAPGRRLRLLADAVAQPAVLVEVAPEAGDQAEVVGVDHSRRRVEDLGPARRRAGRRRAPGPRSRGCRGTGPPPRRPGPRRGCCSTGRCCRRAGAPPGRPRARTRGRSR